MAVIFGRFDEARMQQLLEDQQAAAVTYEPSEPHGIGRHTRSMLLGSGVAIDERARAVLRAWAAHTEAGLKVHPLDAPIEVGATVIQAIGAGPVHVVAAARITEVVDDERCFGFTYTSLPIHPEEGERSFFVRRSDDGTVHFEVEAAARPRGRLRWQAIGPAVRIAARLASSRYCWGMGRAVSSPLR
jgi:uncharacterized protein (UPF0548 family)